jgi:hypothetical protein
MKFCHIERLYEPTYSHDSALFLTHLFLNITIYNRDDICNLLADPKPDAHAVEEPHSPPGNA